MRNAPPPPAPPVGAPRRPPARPAAAPRPPSAAPSSDNVADLVLLLSLAPDADSEQVLDELWSTQYLAPGALCAFAGGARSAVPPSAAAASSSPPLPSAVTHALHVRFANAAAGAAFLAHPAFTAAAALAAAAADGDPAVLLFGGSVRPPSLESLFRRGPEWETGVERVFVLAQEAGADDAAADAWLSDVASLAESSAAGALQATGGRLDGASSAAGEAATHALLTRFADADALAAFLALPPLAALGGGAGAPLRLVGGATYDIAPAQGVAKG